MARNACAARYIARVIEKLRAHGNDVANSLPLFLQLLHLRIRHGAKEFPTHLRADGVYDALLRIYIEEGTHHVDCRCRDMMVLLFNVVALNVFLDTVHLRKVDGQDILAALAAL